MRFKRVVVYLTLILTLLIINPGISFAQKHELNLPNFHGHQEELRHFHSNPKAAQQSRIVSLNQGRACSRNAMVALKLQQKVRQASLSKLFTRFEKKCLSTVRTSGELTEKSALSNYTEPYTKSHTTTSQPAPKKRKINSTAPNALTQFLTGNLIDSDGDGMTNVAERKFGFKPYDKFSFPTMPAKAVDVFDLLPRIPVDTVSNLRYYIYGNKLIFEYSSAQEPSNYGISLKDSAGNFIINNGLSNSESKFSVNLEPAMFQPGILLSGDIHLYIPATASESYRYQTLANFVVEPAAYRAQHPTPATLVGGRNNRLSYSFSANFPEESKLQYNNFLIKLWPLLNYYLGPPAENFNIVFDYMGADSNYFITVENGRKISTDGSFIPRLIVHELVHAWKGKYSITSSADWTYDQALSGFEEGMAEGLAFEIMREFILAYPSDEASLKVCAYKPFQYWSVYSSSFDFVRRLRYSESGNFWKSSGLETVPYSVSATTFQYLVRRNPLFARNFLKAFYQKINIKSSWRPTRSRIVALWKQQVPRLHGVALNRFLDATPVFAGKNPEAGRIFPLFSTWPYADREILNIAMGYSSPVSDGQMTYGVFEKDLSLFPEWLKFFKKIDGYFYLDIQGSRVEAKASSFTTGKVAKTLNTKLAWDRDREAGPTGFGWIQDASMVSSLKAGLYKLSISFPDFLPYDLGAQESVPLIGRRGLKLSKDDLSILVGFNSIKKGKARLVINGYHLDANIKNNLAVFRSPGLALDTMGVAQIYVTSDLGKQLLYERTILDSGDLEEFRQHSFFIVDHNQDGIEESTPLQ